MITTCLLCSTGHLSRKTCNGLNDFPLIGHYAGGLLVSVIDEEEVSELDVPLPPDLKIVMDYAREHGCHFIRFDEDLDVAEDAEVGLPLYDWDSSQGDEA